LNRLRSDGEQQARREPLGTAADDGDLRSRVDLSFSGRTAELEAGFVEAAVAVEPATGELAAAGAERQISGE
jgi:hypothetical protein